MPDHVHFFVAGPREFHLSAWVRALKLALSSRVERPGPHWQEGFVDHLLRHEESYEEKWEYVWLNPVRANLVSAPEAWPYAGEYAALPFD